MSIIRKNTLGAKEIRDMDDAAAKLEKLEANQDYIAMMSDIELETEETEESEEE